MAKILVIEDETLVSQTVEVLLMKAGHTVATAPDGVKGIAVHQAENPDLIITDVIMPEKDGIETIRQLRAISPDIPIIAISGGGRTKNFDFLRIAHRLGATEVLRKPFANDELMSVINRCLAAR